MIQAILRRCKRCGRYTLRKDKCPVCGGEVENPHPPKFSPEDKYGLYRLAMKIVSGKLQVSDEVKMKILSKIFSSGQEQSQGIEEKE